MTQPYYEDDLVTLYLGSCLEVDKWRSTSRNLLGGDAA
jgi:hypothetical protein